VLKTLFACGYAVPCDMGAFADLSDNGSCEVGIFTEGCNTGDIL